MLDIYDLPLAERRAFVRAFFRALLEAMMIHVHCDSCDRGESLASLDALEAAGWTFTKPRGIRCPACFTPMRRRNINYEWHRAVNRFNTAQPRGTWRHWMYEAMDAYAEIPRLAKIFAMERLGRLRQMHQQCSRQEPEPLPENHLTCCLGVRCAQCPELIAVGAAELTPEEIDNAKAWTCAVHIISTGGDQAKEGYVLDESDRLYWRNLYENLTASEDQPDPETP